MPTDGYTCPWCEQTTANGDELRAHLLVEHRKNELAAFVVERLEERDDPEREREPAAVPA